MSNPTHDEKIELRLKWLEDQISKQDEKIEKLKRSISQIYKYDGRCE